MVVHSVKTEHHQGHEKRVVPIFPEVKPYLEESFDPSNEYCINRYRDSKQNLRTTFLKIIYKAGLDPWPKLFHNLRSSCQTDLANKFPAHVVCQWLGNSEIVAKEHYLQVTEEHFEQAKTSTKKEDLKQYIQASETARNSEQASEAKNEKIPEIVGFGLNLREMQYTKDGRNRTRTCDLNDVNVAL